MSKQKKFGAFDGVFTPSILTILGVIMYLRMGWVVGNAGLWGSIIIIVVANVISISTGLSISSVATDKKVGIGGVYYMLSRSLGLPIGGAIGLTLFVGTALSISLYLVGFSESFNAYWGLSTDVNGFRLTGTVFLLILTMLAFISTSIAIKTQFLILAAIAASLVSVLLGQPSVNGELVPPFSSAGSASMETVFAVFFPAVTGFTAGIAMSGDLKNPKKDIPIGTIASIAVGFVVYVGLAVYLGLNVDQQQLLNDYNILSRIAFFAPAVIAGIWGATLSSAIGGILGAPRILQGMSLDRISPRIFARGYGLNNEPRNALILTVLISEAGILIGELDLIARILSMFYLAAYGFINISFFLESWASSDFKPYFRVSRWIGLVGFLATFAVMFQLDPAAMVIAFLLIGGIYLWLQRRQISLGTGDVWQSVWSTVVKSGLKRMEVAKDHKRNWKPNIMLFSGNSEARPHLIEFSKSLAQQVGMVTNFDLIENKESKVLFPKHQQNTSDELLQKYGVFGRRIEVNNVYKGIETLANTFGFSGLDPNAILMGWARNTKNPIWFAQMTEKLIALDYNVLYLDYDKRVGFGKYQLIDMWWRGISNNAELMLHLARFLSGSPEWRNARIRVLLVNDFNVDRRIIENRIQLLLEEFRVQAEIRVINNAAERKPFYELMKSISAQADLIFIGIPDIQAGEEAAFVKRTNDLVGVIPTTLLVKASSTFETTELGLKFMAEKEDYEADTSQRLVPLSPSQSEEVSRLARQMDQQFRKAASEFVQDTLAVVQQHYQEWLDSLEKQLETLLNRLEEPSGDFPALLDANLTQLSQSSQRFRRTEIRLLQGILEQGILDYRKRRARIVSGMPTHLTISDPEKEDRKIQVPFRKALMTFYQNEGEERLQEALRTLLAANRLLLQKSERFLRNFRLGLSQDQTDSFLPSAREHTRSTFQKLRQQLHRFVKEPSLELRSTDRNISNRLSQVESRKAYRQLIRTERRRLSSKQQKAIESLLQDFSALWARDLDLAHQRVESNLRLTQVSANLYQQKEQLSNRLQTGFVRQIQGEVNRLARNVRKARKELREGAFPDEQTNSWLQSEADLDSSPNVLWRFMEAAKQMCQDLPEEVKVLSPQETEEELPFNRTGSIVNLSLRDIALYLIDKQFISPFQEQLGLLRRQLNQVNARLHNQGHLIHYGMEVALKEKKQEELKAILARSDKELKTLKKEIQDAFQSFQTELKERYEATEAMLRVEGMAARAEELSQYVRERGRFRGLGRWRDRLGRQMDQFRKRLSGFLRKQQEGVRAWVQDRPSIYLPSDRGRLQAFADQVSSDYKASQKVSFYYRQLFSDKHLQLNRERESRRQEMAAVQRTLRFQDAGLQGGIMVTGEPLSGKSFFLEYAARRLGTDRILRIVPPRGGAIAPRALQRAFEQATGQRGTIPQLLQALPPKTCILMEDIELWWLKTTEGDRVLVSLIDMVRRFSGRHLFFFSAGREALNHLRQHTPLDRALANTLVLSPLSKPQLRKALYSRHTTGGLQLRLSGKEREDLNRNDWRRLTNRFYRSSRGNIGAALLQWKSRIELGPEGSLQVNIDQEPVELPELEASTWYFVLMHLYLHKALSRSRFALLFKSEGEAWIEEQIDELVKSRILKQHNGDVLELKPLVRYHLRKVLKEKGLL